MCKDAKWFFVFKRSGRLFWALMIGRGFEHFLLGLLNLVNSATMFMCFSAWNKNPSNGFPVIISKYLAYPYVQIQI